MTTTISLPTRDCIVIGCDSLATTPAPYLNPHLVLSTFFEESGALKIDQDGNPLLKSSSQLRSCTEYLPVNQLPNATKLFRLGDLPAGLLFAGNSRIGDQSIRALVENCVEQLQLNTNTDLLKTADQLLDFLNDKISKAYPDDHKENRPSMDIILSGYSKDSWKPEILRIKPGIDEKVTNELENEDLKISFGGQYDVIERVVHGIDFDNFYKLNLKHENILLNYHKSLQEWLKKEDSKIEIPEPDLTDENLKLFGRDFGGVCGIITHLGNLSEQAAINLVEFLIQTMINAQYFSDRIPTVGGQIHVALINPKDGFKWISKEEFKFKGHSVPRYEH